MSLLAIILSGIVVGCASQPASDQGMTAGLAAPEAPATAEAGAGPTSAPAAPQAATASGAATPADAKKAAEPVDLVALQRAGYKIVNQNGTTLYCKKEPILNSRLRTETRCLTASEIEQESRAASDAISDMSRKVQNPPGD